MENKSDLLFQTISQGKTFTQANETSSSENAFLKDSDKEWDLVQTENCAKLGEP